MLTSTQESRNKEDADIGKERENVVFDEINKTDAQGHCCGGHAKGLHLKIASNTWRLTVLQSKCSVEVSTQHVVGLDPITGDDSSQTSERTICGMMVSVIWKIP
jgi:hypothetical protein